MLISLLAFFGVVVDMAHVALHMGSAVDFLLGVLEDGGEMVVASLTLWYVFLLAVRDPGASLYVCDAVRTAISERRGAAPSR